MDVTIYKKVILNFERTGKVTIGEYAFVGANCTILPNVVGGKNAIVGAGSVVTKDVPENTIVAWNPAKKIKMIQKYVDQTTGVHPSVELESL